jgi:hypothetical protein
MSDNGLFFGGGFILLGLICVVLAIPLILGRVRRNPWYGIRISAAFESDEAWCRINRHGGRSLLYYGIALAAIGLFNSFALPARLHPVAILTIAFLPALLLIPMLIHLYRYPRS